ncbi:serine/threonine-protein kinase [Streptomyces sp. NPDC048057]|uniref:serine/threonine-protein kinase n=1 Tax=Streptomyces sp. NPDC048057 TaxID=3155628 RepID=UPI0033FFAD7D
MGEVFAARYELIDPIGHGGVGAVWRAWDHRRRRYVAAKVLQQGDAHTLLRFVREQATRIDHPHVLAPASWAADDDKVLFTMDLVGGGSLAHVIGDYGPLPPRYVCTLLDQLLSGLSAVHAEGVVHRDIKPANILMEATGTGRPHLRLSDFGISMRKGEPRLTEANYVVGTPGYFAPEQMAGAEPDFPADLFAVGLVGLYLLQGQKPDAGALVDHFAEHGTPSAPLGLPEPLWQVLAGLLQPDPEDRFRSAAGARKALLAAVDALPDTGPDDEPVEIFDQLEPLPSGFGPNGPTGPPSPGRAAAPGARAFGGPDTGQGPVTPSPVPPPAQPATPSQPSSGLLVPAPPSQPPTPPPHPIRPAQPAPPHTGQPHTPTPPPVPPVPLAAPAPEPTPSPAPAPPSEAVRHGGYGAYGTRYETPPTRPYTAPQPQAPLSRAERRRHERRRKRTGPPPKVAIPVLLLALICFAVGFWALGQA